MPENASRDLLGKGMLGWFSSIPYAGNPANVPKDRIPAVSLTPRAIAEQTGLMIIARTFSNWGNFNPVYHTPALVPGFRPGYVAPGIVAISTKRFYRANSTKSVKLLRSCMESICQRVNAKMDDQLFERLKGENLDKKTGEVPVDVQRALQQWDQRRRDFVADYRV